MGLTNMDEPLFVIMSHCRKAENRIEARTDHGLHLPLSGEYCHYGWRSSCDKRAEVYKAAKRTDDARCQTALVVKSRFGPRTLMAVEWHPASDKTRLWLHDEKRASKTQPGRFPGDLTARMERRFLGSSTS